MDLPMHQVEELYKGWSDKTKEKSTTVKNSTDLRMLAAQMGKTVQKIDKPVPKYGE